MSIDYPEEYFEVIFKIGEFLKIERDIIFIREFTEGKTDSKVFLIDIQSDKFKGNAILKLSKRSKDSEEDESTIHKKAFEANKNFSQKRFCDIVCCCSTQTHVGIVILFALDDYTLSQTFFQLNLNHQKVILGDVASSILSEWNSDYKVGKTLYPPTRFLASWLGYRIEPDKGRINNFLEEHCDIGMEDTVFSYLNEILPNPYPYCLREDLWQNLTLLPFKGRLHNDFHGYNLIVWFCGAEKHDYKLIDLTEFKNESFLFFDHSYFELTYLYKYFSELPFQRWHRILNKVIEIKDRHFSIDGIETDEYGPILALSFLIESVTNWSKKHEPNRKAHVEAQFLLSKVAAGLSFTHKQIDHKFRKIAFLYAAISLKVLLKKFDIHYMSTDYAKPINVKDKFTIPTTEDWKKAYNSLKHFDDRNFSYVLITGKNIGTDDKELLKALGRINWSLIIDFDQDSPQNGLFSLLEEELNKTRAVRLLTLGDKPQINYKEATAWLMTNGLSGRQDTIFNNTQKWRVNYSPYIRSIATDLKKKVSPQPIVLVVITGDIEPEKLRNVWENADEVFMGEEETFIFNSNNESKVQLNNYDNVETLECGIDDLLSGIWSMKGHVGGSKPQIPIRSETTNKRTITPIDEKTYQYLKEDLEIVHYGLAKETLGDTKPVNDFFRGLEITWREIENGIDIHRDATENLKELIRGSLDKNRIEIIDFQHSPGSGATTITKRILWDLKELYPACRITHLSANTAVRLEKLFHMTKFPVVVVAENSIVPYSKLQKLKNDLFLRNARMVFIYVNRSIDPKGKINLNRSMILTEAERFEGQYKRRAPVSKHQAIMGLKNNEKYRLPFFYGLFAFENEFMQVSSFVEYHLEEATHDVKTLLSFLSLITRYSQSQLPEIIFEKHFNLKGNAAKEIEKYLGEAPSRLILHRDKKLSIVHPIIAEEILNCLYGGGNQAWHLRLGDLAIKFIDWITELANGESERVLEILTQMFINRMILSDLNRQYFSELIHDIPTNEMQNEVLKHLVNNCPNEAHFWNHYGRHHMYVLNSNYKQSEEYLETALDLDPDNEIHYHTLGMIYRNEVRNSLNMTLSENYKGESHTPDEALELCDDLIDKAEEQFRKTREIDSSNEYGYVTHIQMIIEIIERLYKVSGCKSYSDFFSRSGQANKWCVAALTESEQLLRQVKNLQENYQYSTHTETCEAKIKQFYDQFDSMISSLIKLIDKSTQNQKMSLRRMIANTIIRRRVNNWEGIESEELHSISDLMKSNLISNSKEFHDLWIWFQSYRRVRSFSMLTAISEFNTWIIQNEHLDAYYYLYILHFLNTVNGISNDYEKAIRYLMKCKQFSSNHIRRTYSFEWYSKAPSWCPIIHRSQLGRWDFKKNFFENKDKIGKLKRLRGNIKDLSKAPQAGFLSLNTFDVFFVPGVEFLCGRDENIEVTFYLGFSYDGLRAWDVKPAKKKD